MAKLRGSIWINDNQFCYIDEYDREWRWIGQPVGPTGPLVPGSFWMELDDIRYVNQAGNYVYQIIGPVIQNHPTALRGSIWISQGFFRWIDRSSNERVAHQDVTHTDGAGGHLDVPHTDTGHGDTHTDGTHGDVHTDVPHSDFHGDGHTDVPHSDRPHTDTHSDGSIHNDQPNYHFDFNDTIHNDGAGHSDINAHGDGGIQHNDHYDTHNDIIHLDAPTVIDHNDQAHQDSPAQVGHIDSSHGDTHSDAPPISVPHQDHTDASSGAHQDNPQYIGP
jgi:hypothetical protein